MDIMKLNQHLEYNDIGVYYIHCIPNDKYYVGYAKNLKKRYNDHKNYLIRGNHPNQHLQNAYNKYGKGSFLFSVIAYCDSIKSAYSIEEYIIRGFDLVDIGFNMQYGGETSEPSDEVKKKLSIINTGKFHTPEARKKMSESRRGKTSWKKGMTYEEIYGIDKAIKLKNDLSNKFLGSGNHFYGRSHSEDTIEKLRASKVDKMVKCEFIDIEGNRYYPEAFTRFCKENGLDIGAMCRVRKGKQSNHKGWICKQL